MTRAKIRATKGLSALGLAVAVIAWVRPAQADVLDSRFVDSEVERLVAFDGDSNVTGMAWAPDGTHRLFVTRKSGQVEIEEDGDVHDTPFAVMTELYAQSECGLLAIAFDPDFVTNHYVYFFVTISNSEQRIVRYRDEGSVGVEPTVILANLPTRGANHDGGALGFGPDGKLYWAIGDNGNGTGSGGDLASPAAKVGRANRDGTLPEGNPFDDGAGPNYDFAWARGFRNPFSMTFQPSTGLLWLNVVGQSYEQVFAVGAGDHGGWAVTERLRDTQYLSPLLAYRTNGSDSFAIAADGASRSGGVATFSTTTEHWLRLGERVTVAGVADDGFDGAGFVTSIRAPNQFSIEQAGPNAVSGGGSATTAALGGCVTGGVFWDSSSVPADFLGNFFFGDFNSGQTMRARVSGTTVSSVEVWGTGILAIVDMDIGPDGDLYYVSHVGPGILHQVRYRATSQRIVVSKMNVRMLEGGRAAFQVRLATAPAGNVAVSVARASGDEDVSVTEGASLAFDASNWQTPKPVYLRAERDADGSEDGAVLEATAPGMSTERVTVRVTDEFRGVEPPGEGGQGGEPGGAAGQAGSARGGAAGNGGASSGGSGAAEAGDGGSMGGSGAPGAGEAGESGNAGEPGGGVAGAAGGMRRGSSPTGCGCSTSRGPGGELGWVVLAACLMRRRTGRPARALRERSSCRFG